MLEEIVLKECDKELGLLVLSSMMNYITILSEMPNLFFCCHCWLMVEVIMSRAMLRFSQELGWA